MEWFGVTGAGFTWSETSSTMYAIRKMADAGHWAGWFVVTIEHMEEKEIWV
jgi:hypothetical protein